MSDHFGAEPLPASLHQRLASLASWELTRAFSAHVLDKHDRCEIFRHRLTDQFAGAADTVKRLDLDVNHDYNKVLHFMETGSWPRGTPDALVRLYPRLLNDLLAPLEAAYKKQAPQEVQAYLHAAGTEATDALLGLVERDADAVSATIRTAHLEGAHVLPIFAHPTLLSLPPHLASLQQLRKLTVGEMETRTWPDMGKLKNLETLSLVRAGVLTVLPESLKDAPRLKLVDVGNANIARPTWLPRHVRFQKDGVVD